MKIEDLGRFCSIFNMPTPEGETMDKEKFVEYYYESGHFTAEASAIFTESKYSMMGMLGISNEGTLEEQRKSILSVINQ